MSEPPSERTPESGGQKALEDIQPEHGALVLPQGAPVSLGPQINPFWSETARDEAILRACRPAHLPQESQEGPSQVPSVSPPREPSEALKVMMSGLLQENARLWSEREAFAASQNAWRQQASSYGPPQSWLGNVLGEGMGHERNAMSALMEVMRSSWNAPQKDRGLLGALANPPEYGHGGFFPRHDQGFPGGCGAMAKGSLMELFNMVASGTSAGQASLQGMMDVGRNVVGSGSSSLPSERSLGARALAASEETRANPSSSGLASGALRPESQGGSGVPGGATW